MTKGATMGERRKVELGVPVGFDYQMVFRKEWREPLPVDERDDVSFLTVANPLAALRLLPAVKGQYRLPMFLKTLIRLAMGRRIAYFLIKDRMIVGAGIAWIGRCRHYWVEPDSAIIGASWTSTDYRRQGLGYHGVASTINALIDRGHRIIYADTDRDNRGGQGIIRRCEWGDPIGLYILGPKPPAE
ncbi:MAG: GNAT family N-acetyltransferase [Candidatus Eisenbacteria bacterium]|nr:GNAT family N-acetyltransferase [Candidatus Eisenbacteria bacterium]